MPPKQKKAAKNAFFFYMQDWKRRKEAEGQRFSMAEVAQFCAEDWNTLPDKDRKRYKDMEAEAKNRDKNDTGNKFNSLGTAFDAIDKEEQEKRDAVLAMEQCIASTLARINGSRSALMNQVFYLVHANVYCYWGQIQAYIPCEVAISKFSLKEGVMATYHVFPAPATENGNIPMGYKFQVKQNRDGVHGIPDPCDFAEMEFDYKKIRSDIHKFLRPNGGEEIPPLYTMDMNETNNNCHISAVRTFFDNVAGDSYDNFRVYSITRLFFKLHEACQQVAMKEFLDHERSFPVEGVAHQQLLRDIYNYSSGLACQFHEDEGEHYHNCSLSFVKRWVFLICEYCCTALRIELIPGRHCVATAQITINWANDKPKAASSAPVAAARAAPAPAPAAAAPGAVDSESDDDEGGAWATVPKAHASGVKAGSTAQRFLQQGMKDLKVDDKQDLFVKPSQPQRLFVTGQSPNVVSEVKVDNTPPSVRLPTTRGRGEMLMRALNQQQQQQQQQQSAPGAAFSATDFPAIGEVRPGQVSKPSGSGWGRGFSFQ